MADPVDILAVATARDAEAWNWYQAAMAMQASSESAQTYQAAQWAWYVAHADLGAVQRLLMDLAHDYPLLEQG
jgi:hypothetical protein